MPTKKNFMGGQQNYDPKTGEYQPSLKGENGEVVTDADGDGKPHEKLTSKEEERFNKKSKLIQKYKDMGYAPDEAQLNAEKELVAEESKKSHPNDDVELDADFERSYGPGGLAREKVKRLYDTYKEMSGGDPKKELRIALDDYINELADGEDTDLSNEMIYALEAKLPFKDHKEHMAWVNMGSTMTDTTEWEEFTKQIIDRGMPDNGDDDFNIEGMEIKEAPKQGVTGKTANDVIDRVEQKDRKPVPFKFDKNKYPDVEQTPYGFIYNVNGHSITDATAQQKKLFPKSFKEGTDYGFLLESDGDEVFYPSFDEAYKAAKAKKNNSLPF